MKSQFARIKNRAKGASTRTLAVMLCFVMLLTAIGSGSVLSAIAAGTASGSTAVADAAQKFADIAGQVDTDAAADDKVAAEDDETSFIVALAKRANLDITDTGRSADIAETGATTYYYRGTNVSGASWDSGAAFTAVTGSSKYVYVTKTNNGDFQITSYQTGWNDSSGRYNRTVDTNYGKGGLTSASGYTNNIGDSNTGTHYIIFDTTSGSHKTFALAAAPVIDTVYIRDDANWGKSNIKLYTFSNSTSGTNSPANGQTLGGWSGTNMTSLDVEELDDNGTTVYKVTGFLHTAGIILNNGSSQTGNMTLTSGHLYATGSDNQDQGAYTEPTPLVNPKTATAIKSGKRNDGTDRKRSGDGTVAINGGTANSSTATATVESGSTVTFTAAANSDSDFNGWYSDEACTTLLTKNTTYTVASMTSDTTVYASFSKKCYLVGKFYLAELAKEVTPAYNDTTYGFTQSSSNPALYTYENDFMFRLSSGEGTYHLQYVTVGHGGSTAYNTASGDAASGTAASGTSNDSNSNKWTCDTGASYTNCYKHVVFTWNAINETLSWTITDIDLTQYTVMYINCGVWHFDHIWIDGGAVLTGSAIDLIGIPYETIGSKAYNILLVKNTTIGTKELKYQLRKTSAGGTGNQTADLGGVYAGGTYTIDTSSDNWNASAGAPTAATVYYLTGWLNGVSTTTTDDSRKFTESATAGIYTLTWTPTADHSGYQYVTIFDGTNAWHPASYKSGTGTAAGTTPDTSPGNDNKWMVEAAANQTVTFTWDTTGAAPVLSWTVSSSGGGSGLTPTSYKLMYGTGNNWTSWTARSETVYKTADNKYYVNLSDFTGDMGNGNHYFALSTDSSYKNIIGIMDNQNTGKSIAVTEDDTGNYLGTTNESSNYTYDGVKHGLTFPRVWRTNSSLKGLTLTIDEDVTTSGKVTYAFVTSDQAIVDGGGGGDTAQTVLVYAKDGAAPIDWDNKGSGGASATSGTAYNYAAIATTAISQIDGATPASGVVSTVNVGDASSQYQTATVDAGKSIQITTTISTDNDWNKKYYVKGWCINGVTYKADGTPGVIANPGISDSTTAYTMNYTIPAEPEVNYLEVTPIYYIKDTSNIITFYVEGYNTIQSKWGNTPYVYPFYGNLNNVENSFGVYPGQPMVYVEGKYSIEIPMKSTTIMAQTSNGTAIKGITVNNGYADHVHRNLIYGWTAADNDAAHKQTYDYDDFYKIYNECLTNAAGDYAGHPNSIIFRIQDEETTYNRSVYGGGKSGQFADGTSNIDISAIASSGNGWELLTNRYDQAINLFGSTTGITKPGSGTTPENDTSSALYVVSTGYNANVAGDYGTMWKIYDGEGKLISTDATNGRYGVPPSVLLLRGTSSGYDSAVARVGYPAASHSVDGVGSYTDNISKYETIYKALQAYTGKRVYITYEKDAQDTRDDSSGTGAYRLDGRWYYTHSTDTVQSTVGIEYWNNATGKWVTDTVSASTGDGTSGGTNKNNVVFDSDSHLSNSERTTSSSKVINDGGTWNFTATAGTGYMFDSWQIKYSDTSYDQIVGAGASASIGATANYTLVARFVPIVTGSLTIDHTLSGSSTGEGTVDMRVRVFASTSAYNNGSGTPLANATFNGSHVYLDGTYISNSLSDYYIEVQLMTTPLYDGTVDAFGYDKFNTDNFISATEAKSATPATSTFGFTVGQLYAGTTLATSSLAYTSTIIETPHYYNFTYSFKTRDNQSKTYTSRGVISLKDYKAYVGDNHVMDTSYVTAKAPFESNFLKTTTLTPTAPTYTSGTHTFAGTYTFTNNAATPLHHVIVKLPYDYYTSNIPSGSKKYSASSTAYNASKATFDLAAYYNEFLTIGATSTVPGSQSKVSKVTDATDTNHTGNDFITAPDELTNSGTTMYFAYWDIKQLKADGVTPSESVAKLYYPDFHYRIYSNYYVEAVYTATAANSWKMKYSDDENNVGANIIYLGDSRNQWNDGSAPSGSSSDSATDAADRIYSDFIFNYADKGAELKGSNRDIGMVIERVIYTDTEDGNKKKWATGSANVTDMYSYKTTYADTEAAMATAITNALKNGTAMPTGCIKQAWSTSDLNNKNFMEQNYNVYSAYGQTVSESGEITYKTDNTIDNYVYRAYAYIKASDGNYYLSDPAYFCMRYTANRKFS